MNINQNLKDLLAPGVDIYIDWFCDICADKTVLAKICIFRLTSPGF